MSTEPGGPSQALSVSERRGVKVLLVGGFLACGAATLAAHRSPATGYELSIYRATPVAFWVGAAMAFLAGITATTFARRRLRAAGVLLSGTAFAAVVGLPILRGYFFYGEYDSLTHLGWAKDIAAGRLSGFDLFYPALHELSLVIEAVTGFALPRSILFAVFLFPLVYVVFVGLAVREVTRSELGGAIGAYAAMLLLPINQIATHYMAPHPFSETVLFSAFPLFLLLRYVRRGVPRGERLAVGGLFALTSVATVLYHPLQAAVLVVVLTAAAGLQTVARRAAPFRPVADHPRVHGLAAVHTAVFLLWTYQKPKFSGTVELVVSELVGVVTGSGVAAASVVQHQSTSLGAVGSGLGDIFVRLFLVSALFGVLGGGVALLGLAGRLPDRFAPANYLAAGLAVVSPLSMFLFVGDVSKLFFRLQGSIMVLLTVLGAVGVVGLVGRAREHVSPSTVRLLVSVLLCLVLVHSMAVAFTSPYVYKSNRQVTQAEFSGYETAFEMGADSVNYAGVRTGPSRYMHAVYGRTNVPESKAVAYHSYARRASVPGGNLSDLGAYFDGDHYLIVTTRDVEREVGAYRGLRYTESELAAVRTQPRVHRVQCNGAVDLYLYDRPGSVPAG